MLLLKGGGGKGVNDPLVEWFRTGKGQELLLLR